MTSEKFPCYWVALYNSSDQVAEDFGMQFVRPEFESQKVPRMETNKRKIHTHRIHGIFTVPTFTIKKTSKFIGKTAIIGSYGINWVKIAKTLDIHAEVRYDWTYPKSCQIHHSPSGGLTFGCLGERIISGIWKIDNQPIECMIDFSKIFKFIKKNLPYIVRAILLVLPRLYIALAPQIYIFRGFMVNNLGF